MIIRCFDLPTAKSDIHTNLTRFNCSRNSMAWIRTVQFTI